MFPSDNISFIVHMHDTMFPIENNISPFSHPGSENIPLLPANLAAQETWQETAFPQQCFLV